MPLVKAHELAQALVDRDALEARTERDGTTALTRGGRWALAIQALSSGRPKNGTDGRAGMGRRRGSAADLPGLSATDARSAQHGALRQRAVLRLLLRLRLAPRSHVPIRGAAICRRACNRARGSISQAAPAFAGSCGRSANDRPFLDDLLMGLRVGAMRRWVARMLGALRVELK